MRISRLSRGVPVAAAVVLLLAFPFLPAAAQTTIQRLAPVQVELALEKGTGDAQTAVPEATLDEPLRIRVVNQAGDGVDGATVRFTVEAFPEGATPGSFVVQSGEVVTSGGGDAGIGYVAGDRAGTYVLQAEALDEEVITPPLTFTVTVVDLQVTQVRGDDTDGTATVTVRTAATASFSSARLRINGSSHSQTGAVSGPEFTLPLDQNAISRGGNQITVEATAASGGTVETTFDATRRERSSFTTKTLSYSFVRENFPLAPIPLPSTLSASWESISYSVPSSGRTGVLLNNGPFDAVVLAVDFELIDRRGTSGEAAATIQFAPDGPAPRAVSPGTRFPSLVGPFTKDYSVEPGRDWWLQPGAASISTSVSVLVGGTSSGGITPGFPIVNDIAVTIGGGGANAPAPDGPASDAARLVTTPAQE